MLLILVLTQGSMIQEGDSSIYPWIMNSKII